MKISNIILKPKEITSFKFGELYGIIQVHPYVGFPEVKKSIEQVKKIIFYKKIIIIFFILVFGFTLFRLLFSSNIFDIISSSSMMFISSIFIFIFYKHLKILSINKLVYRDLLSENITIQSDELKFEFDKFLEMEKIKNMEKIKKIRKNIPDFGNWIIN